VTATRLTVSEAHKPVIPEYHWLQALRAAAKRVGITERRVVTQGRLDMGREG